MDRLRWDNIARAAAVLAVIALVVAWPRLRAQPPALPPAAATPVTVEDPALTAPAPARAVEATRRPHKPRDVPRAKPRRHPVRHKRRPRPATRSVSRPVPVAAAPAPAPIARPAAPAAGPVKAPRPPAQQEFWQP
jgi:hypothetical protein